MGDTVGDSQAKPVWDAGEAGERARDRTGVVVCTAGRSRWPPGLGRWVEPATREAEPSRELKARLANTVTAGSRTLKEGRRLRVQNGEGKKNGVNEYVHEPLGLVLRSRQPREAPVCPFGQSQLWEPDCWGHSVMGKLMEAL